MDNISHQLNERDKTKPADESTGPDEGKGNELPACDDDPENKPLLSRRKAVRGGVAALGVGIVGMGGMLYSTQPVVAVSTNYESTDLTLAGDGGEVSRLTIENNSFDVAWEGFGDFDSEEGDEVEVDIKLTAVNDDLPGNPPPVTVFDETFTEATGVTQARSHNFDTLTPDPVDLIRDGEAGDVDGTDLADAGLDPTDLNADEDGTTNETDIVLESSTTVRVVDSGGVELQDATTGGGNGRGHTITLTVENIAANVDSDGSSTTDGDAE